MAESIRGFFTNCDQVGVAPTLNYKKAKEHGTVTGGLISVGMTIFTIVLTIGAFYTVFYSRDWNIQV